MTTINDKPTSGTVVDVGLLVDESRWSGYQKFVTLLAAMCILVDGFDSLALSFALPTLLGDWGVAGSAFAPVFAFGLVGVSIGAVCGGLLSDRYGRRPVLLASVLLFGGFSLAMSVADQLATLLPLRFLAAIGLGGAMPTATSLVSETMPARLRTVLVTLTVVCFPLGGSLGGLLAGYLLPFLGWRSLFVIGGGAALLLALLLYVGLPESPRFLARNPRRWPELSRVLKRMGCGEVAAESYVDSTERPRVDTSLWVLVGPQLRRNTVLLCLAFSFSLLAMQWVVSWVPTLLTGVGLGLSTASLGLSAYNLGGVIGSVVLGFVVANIGSRIALMLALLGAAVAAAWLAMMQLQVSDGVSWIIIGLGVHGMFAHAAQTSLSALAVHVYPTSVRATGSGVTIALGRVVAALSGSFTGPLLIGLGTHWYFFALSAGFMVTLLVLQFVTRHIEPVSSASN